MGIATFATADICDSGLSPRPHTLNGPWAPDSARSPLFGLPLTRPSQCSVCDCRWL